MLDAIDRALANAERMRHSNVKSAATVDRIISSASRFNSKSLSVAGAQEQLSHFKGWVWSAVRLVAQRIAQQRVCVGKKPTRGRRHKSAGECIEPLESHSLLDALADPSELQTYWSLMFVTVASLEICGRSLWWVTKDTRDGNKPTILHLPTPWIVGVDPQRTAWKIRPNGAVEEFTIRGDEVLHLFYPDPADPNGAISPLSRIAEAVLVDQEIQTGQHAAFENGVFPKVILTAGRLPDTPGMPGERPTLTADQRRQIIYAIKQAYGGTMNSGEPLILDSLIEKVEKLSHTPSEMDWMNSSKLTKSRILQAYGVSPILLGEVEGANRASATVADEIFVSNKVNPLIEMLSQAMTEWLGPMFATPREKLVVWIEPAVAHDPDISLKQWELGAKMGYVSQNEFRRSVLNLADVPGGDEFSSPAGMLPRVVPQRNTNGKHVVP
ncbi:MAG: phage portal protein [Phycisphaerae bacterium]